MRQPVAPDIAETDVVRVLMPLDDGDFQDILRGIDMVGIAAVDGDDLPRHHADHGVGALVAEVPGRERRDVERVVRAAHEVRVDLRRVELAQDAVVHELASLIDHLDIEVAEVVDDDEVAEVARRDGAAVIEQEVPRGVVAIIGSTPREMAFLTM